jgi:hypothetical protein
MENKKNMNKIKAGAAIFVVIVTAIIVASGPSMIADITDPLPQYHDSVTVTLSATDDISGVAVTMYRVLVSSPSETPAPEFQEYSGPFDITGLGTYTIEYYSIDNYGNQEAVKTTSFQIIPLDVTPPVTQISIAESPVPID